MNITLVDKPDAWRTLHPITLTRSISSIRIGLYTLLEKWQLHLPDITFHISSCEWLSNQDHLWQGSLCIDSTIIPDEQILATILALKQDECLCYQGNVIATYETLESKNKKSINYQHSLKQIQHLWEILPYLQSEIKNDILVATRGKRSHTITDTHTILYSPDNIFIEEGVKCKSAIINAEEGPVYIGKNTTIHEGAIVKGPFVCGEDCHINMGAKLRGNVALGNACVVSGELKNVQFQGYSNKGHDGYLGDSYIGEWCNLGAGTTNSNLKNNLSSVKLWNMMLGRFVDSNKQKLGVFMGDYVCTAIQTLIPTGAVIGTMSNVVSEGGFVPKYMPPFTWLKAGQKFKFAEACNSVRALKALKNQTLSDAEIKILEKIYDYTQ